jgi:hypothetical protein
LNLPTRLGTETSRPRDDRSRIEHLDAKALARDLERAVRGEVRFDAPRPLLRPAGSTDGPGTAVARVLGARHLAQSLATVIGEHRTPVLVDAGMATTFCVLGMFAARSDGAGRLAWR